ncbi:MAG: hypothetical protein IJ568_05530 [Bacilli bacterium]|nr:hypothetical protein [Bacilli bacterium]
MIDTEEYYGGTYPTPNEAIDCDIEDEDYDEWYADYYHDEMMIGMID